MSDQKIRLAYSPDSDDAFMVHAIKHKLIDCGHFTFELIPEDIEALNRAALAGKFDISAVSLASYPDIADSYWLMPVGASIGDGFGPAIISLPERKLKPENLAGQKVAVPGLKTSAYFAACLLLPEFEPKPLPFDQIASAVQTRQVDAGILIHELQLDCESAGFFKVADLGTLWHQRFHLPMPLGGIVIRRALGRTTIDQLTAIYRASIHWALNHRDQTVTLASKQAKAGLEGALADRYIAMYVNERSLSIADDTQQALAVMYEHCARRGLCPSVDLSNAFYDV